MNRGRDLVVAWAQLAVLWAFAFAKPLFDVLADSPEFFVARGNTRGDIIILALGLTVLPPTALLAVELLFLRLGRVRRLLHALLVGILVAAIALQALEDLTDGSSSVLIPAALALGLGAVLAYTRTRGADGPDGAVPRAALAAGRIPRVLAGRQAGASQRRRR